MIQLGRQGKNQPRTGGPDRMAQGDRAAIDIYLGIGGFGIQAQRSRTGHTDGREGLINLDQVQRGRIDTGPLAGLLNRIGRL